MVRNRCSLIPMPPGRGSISADTEIVDWRSTRVIMAVPLSPKALYTKYVTENNASRWQKVRNSTLSSTCLCWRRKAAVSL